MRSASGPFRTSEKEGQTSLVAMEAEELGQIVLRVNGHEPHDAPPNRILEAIG